MGSIPIHDFELLDSARRKEIHDLELLGDLHLKQGHYLEAGDAFQRAMTGGPGTKGLARLYRKMAQCYLALGQDEEVRKVLDYISMHLKEPTDAKDKPSPASKPVVALPVKLTITAPKKLLDQAKEGKISFEEFRRQAHVETLRFNDSR